MYCIQYYSCFWHIWDFNLNFSLKFKEAGVCSEGKCPCPLNEALLVAQLSDDCVYTSLDSVPDKSKAIHFLVEFLNSLEVFDSVA